MALKWYQQVDIVQRESDLTRRKAETALDFLQEQKRLRREQEEREAAERKQVSAQNMLASIKAHRRGHASDDIVAANQRLSQLGFTERIPITESSIASQIHSGFNWAQQAVLDAEGAFELAQQEAEVKLRSDIVGDLLKQGLITYDTNPDEIEKLTQQKMAEYYAEDAFKRGDYDTAQYWNNKAKEIEAGGPELPEIPMKDYGGVAIGSTPEMMIHRTQEDITAITPVSQLVAKTKINIEDAKVQKDFVKALTPVTETNVGELLEYFQSNPELLRSSLIGEGRNPTTESLIEELYPGITEPQISDYFSIEARVIESKLAEGGGGKWGTFTAGVGDLVANVGGILRWKGSGGIGEKLTRLGRYMQAQAEPVPFEPMEFTWRQIFNPQFWATYGIRMLPTLMVLLIPGLGGYSLAGRLATTFKLGKFSKAILTGIGGAAMSRPLESALEAGNAYDIARQRGLSHEEADKVSDEVFNKNMRLMGLDAVQFAVAFAPVGGITNAAMAAVRKGLITTAKIGGKLFIVGLTEGGEEVYQEIIQKQALGEKVDLSSPELQLVFALGAAAGVGLGAAGDIMIRIETKTKAGLTPTQSDKLDTYTQGFISQGETEDVATVKALDKLIKEEPQVSKVVEQATKEVEKELIQEQVKPKKVRKPKVAKETVSGVPEISITIKPVRDYWNTNLERNALRRNPETQAGTYLSTWIEAGGDIIRELGKDVSDLGYIRQKFDRIEKALAYPSDWTLRLSEGEETKLLEVKRLLEGLPVVDEKTQVIKDLIAAITNRNTATVKASLNKLEPLLFKAPPVTEVTPETTAMVAEETITGEIPEGEIIIEGLEPVRNIRKLQSQYTARRIEYDAAKKQLVDYAKANLPLEARGKMLASVKNVRTEAELQKAISLANKYAEQAAQKTLKTQITNELRKIAPTKVAGMRYGKFTPATQKALNQIKNNTNLDRETVKGEIIKNIEAAEEGKITFEQADEANELLAYSGVKGMSSDELANTLRQIKSLKETGRGLKATEKEAETERITGVREQVIKTITGGKGIKPGVGTVDTKGLWARDTKLKSFVTYWQFGMDDDLDYISRLDKASKPFQSPASQLGFRLHMSRSTQDKGVQTYVDGRTADKVKEIYDLKGRRELNGFMGRMIQTKVDLGTFATTEGVKVNLSLTKGQIIQKYLELRDPTLDETFREGMKWTDEMISAVKDSMTAEDLKLAEWFAKFNQEYGLTIKPVFEDKYHIPFPENPYYVHLAREKEGDMYAHLLRAQNGYRYAGVTSNSLKARVKNKIPLKFTDAFQTHVRHVIEMEHFKAFSASMKEARMVFGDKDVRTAIRQYHGAEVLKHIDRHLDQIARDGADRALTAAAVDKLRGHFTLAALGVKVAVSFKQALSLPAYLTYAEMPLADFFTGVADFWKHPLASIKEMKEASGYLTERWGRGHERDVRFVKEKDVAGRLSNVKNWRDLLMLGIHKVDTAVTQPGSWAIYRSMKKQGLGKVEAITHAEVATKRSQPSFGMEDMAALRKQGSFGKLFTMFQSQPNKYYRLIANSARNLKAGRGSKGRNTLNILLAWWVLPMMFQLVSDAFQWKKEHQLRVAILGPANYLLAAGQLLQSAYGWIAGEPYPAEASPVFSTLRELQYAITGTVKLIDQGRDPLKEVDTDYLVSTIEHYAKGVGQIIGVPTPYAVQVERAIRNADIRQMIFSEYALKNESDAVSKLQDIYAREICGKDSWRDLTSEQQDRFWELRPDLK